MHESGLIFTVAVSLSLAFILGFVAFKLRLSPIVGYLIAGVCIGPHTPGVVANTELASELSEIGVILLMFGVGLHFSIKDLLAVSRVAFLGALPQTILSAIGGAALAALWGWPWGACGVVGLAMAVASTIVVIGELEKRDLMAQPEGKTTIGWLLAQDLVVVLLLALLPALAPMLKAPHFEVQQLVEIMPAFGIATAKAAVFIAVMLFAGRRFFPWVLDKVAETGSRELFTLFVIGVPISVALFAAHLFGVSLALGAFLAGMVMNESDLSHHAAARAMPLQDAFAVLFFVSTGMSFKPSILMTHTWQVVSAVAFALAFTPVVAFLLVVFVMRYSSRVAAIVAPSLAQIGEFSLVLATLGARLDVLPDYAYATVVGAVLISICLHSLMFRVLNQVAEKVQVPGSSPMPEYTVCEMKEHAVLIGYGRVGSVVGDALLQAGVPFVVIEENRDIVERLREKGMTCVFGNADISDVLREAAVEKCKLVIVTSPNPFSVRLICDEVQELNQEAAIVVRTHSDKEAVYLKQKEQVKLVVFAEIEVANTIANFVRDTKLI